MIQIQRKYARFFLVETRFRLRFIALFVCVLIIIFLSKISGSQGSRLVVFQKQSELVKKIPEMEKAIMAKEEKPEDFVPKVVIVPEAPKELHFEGSSDQEGVLHTVIDGEILMQGDRIGNYIVTKIEIGFVQLQHIETKETKEYYFEYSQ